MTGRGTRFPPNIRYIGAAIFSLPGFSTLGKKLYELVAVKVGKNLSKSPIVREIQWRGGAVTNLVPGISDLDFSIYIDTLLNKPEEELSALAEQYRAVRDLYLIPGEVLLFDTLLAEVIRRYPPGAFVRSSPYRAFNKGTWSEIAQRSPSISNASLFSYYLRLFHTAIDHIVASRRSSELYNLYVGRKILLTLLGLLEGKPSGTRKELSVSALCSQVLAQLNLVAEHSFFSEDFVQCPSNHIDLEDEEIYRMYLEYLQQGLLKAAADTVEFNKEYDPRLCIVRRGDATFFDAFFRFSSEQRLNCKEIPIKIISPSMVPCIQRGWWYGPIRGRVHFASSKKLERAVLIDHVIDLSMRLFWIVYFESEESMKEVFADYAQAISLVSNGSIQIPHEKITSKASIRANWIMIYSSAVNYLNTL